MYKEKILQAKIFTFGKLSKTAELMEPILNEFLKTNLLKFATASESHENGSLTLTLYHDPATKNNIECSFFRGSPNDLDKGVEGINKLLSDKDFVFAVQTSARTHAFQLIFHAPKKKEPKKIKRKASVKKPK